MRDPWGMPYYPVFEQNTVYSDRIVVQAAAGSQQQELGPVTARLRTVRLRSRGLNTVKGDSDDFDLVQFSTIVSEQSANDAVPQPVRGPDKVVFTDETGAIAGTVTDSSEAAIPNATIIPTSDATAPQFQAKTNEQD